MMLAVDQPTYEGLHPSDRLALHFHAALCAAEGTVAQALRDQIDAWIRTLGPRFPTDVVERALAACEGTPLEPMRLGDRSLRLGARFVQIAFSERAGGSKARIVSEDTLGVSGGLSFKRDLSWRYIERHGGNGTGVGERGDWFFAPRGLMDPACVGPILARPLQVEVRPSDQHGFVLAVMAADRMNLGWAQKWSGFVEPGLGGVPLSNLARELELASSLGGLPRGFATLLTRLPEDLAQEREGTILWAPAGAEAIVRFSALLATGQTLTLDPGSGFPDRAIATVELAMPGEGPTALACRLQRRIPVLTAGLWANLKKAPAPPWPTQNLAWTPEAL